MSFNPPPLPPMQPAWAQFQVWWQQVLNSLSETLTGIEGVLADISALQAIQATIISDLSDAVVDIAAAQAAADAAAADAAAAQSTADSAATDAATAQTTATSAATDAATAQTTATAADATATAAKVTDAISSSATAPGGILSAADAGSNATVTIVDHVRLYGDAAQVSVTGGAITALSYSTDYFVYYDDPTRVGGSVTYHATLDAKEALPNYLFGRHFCGPITTPAAAGAPTTGGVTPPSGGGAVHRDEMSSI